MSTPRHRDSAQQDVVKARVRLGEPQDREPARARDVPDPVGNAVEPDVAAGAGADVVTSPAATSAEDSGADR